MMTATLNVDEVVYFANDFLIHDDDEEEIYDESSPNGCLCYFQIKKVKQKSLLDNESKLLEKLIATCNGKPTIPIRNFSEKELRHATHNYDPQHLFYIEIGHMYGIGVLLTTAKLLQLGSISANKILIGAMHIHLHLI
jgi:hypothetical protein